MESDPAVSPYDAWICFMCGGDMDNPTAKKMYFGDTDVTTGADNVAGGMVYNGVPFFIGTDGFGNDYIGDMADLRIMIGQYVDFSVEANRRLFIDASGKPVDPVTTTATLGGPGCVLFSGDATGFAVNQGTGGAFSLTGTLTNASTSPSD